MGVTSISFHPRLYDCAPIKKAVAVMKATTHPAKGERSYKLPLVVCLLPRRALAALPQSLWFMTLVDITSRAGGDFPSSSAADPFGGMLGNQLGFPFLSITSQTNVALSGERNSQR